MKYTIYLLSGILLFLMSCDQIPDINSSLGTVINKKLIDLPEISGLNIEEIVSYYKEIDGDDGGWFSAQHTYQGGPYGNITITTFLYFPEDSFNGDKNISQTMNTETADVDLGPSMQFDRTVKFTLTITGLDLSGINPEDLDFVYIDSNGNMYDCDYEYVTMDLGTGMLKVKSARLSHFSRYGFVN
jgi:hypothetical protein